MKIAVACGGTGGHIIPGLTTAEALKRRGHEVELWLAGGAVEAASTAGWTGPVICVKAAGFPSGVSLKAVASAARLAAAVVVCIGRMGRRRPDALLAMGSYASVGPALAARFLGVPVVLHEANAIPGRAIGFLSRYAACVAVTFPDAVRHFPGRRVEVTGYPLRTDLAARFEPGALLPGRFNVLVMGGSQGAHRLNDVIPGALARLHRAGLSIQVIHLAGTADAEAVRARYREAGVPGLVFDFLKEIGKAYGAAHLAIARSGAGTCTELAACGLPAVLVPLPTSARDHQLANARAMAATGGMAVMEEGDLSEASMAGYIEGVYREAGRLAAMRAKLSRAAATGAAERIAILVEEAAGARG